MLYLFALLFAVCLLIKNYIVAASLALVSLLAVLKLNSALAFLDDYAIPLGILTLTAGVLVPLADGRISSAKLISALLNPTVLLSFAIGVCVAYLGGRGVTLLKAQPLIVPGITLGTLCGVVFFRGIPVGPLIAAGMTAVLAGALGLFNK